jgi:hypothetical protein
MARQQSELLETPEEVIAEYRKNKRPVSRKSTVFTQPVIATDPTPKTNSFRIPPASQQKPRSPIADSTVSRPIPANGPDGILPRLSGSQLYVF